MYRHWVAFASALLMTTTIAGGLRAAPASAAPSPTKAGARITITGDALDVRPTGKPLDTTAAPRVAHAHVHVSPANADTFTDAHGHFTLVVPSTKPQTIEITKP